MVKICPIERLEISAGRPTAALAWLTQEPASGLLLPSSGALYNTCLDAQTMPGAYIGWTSLQGKGWPSTQHVAVVQSSALCQTHKPGEKPAA
jgi:hypothetical protein